MDEYVLRTTHLTKKYQNVSVLDDINLSVKKGEIYGFIGKNGAGKSTLLRIVTGLAFPSSGSVELFGQQNRTSLPASQKRIGAIIESPAFFPHMTAYENLEAQRLQKGIPGKARVDKTLALVGLSDAGKKQARHFSLGMKQRLGLAMSLLSDPELLILDEPTNGLDPMGIVELRELLKRLNREKGLTIVISSHILSELRQLATCYGFIHEGKLIEQISAKELEEKRRQHLRIKVDEPAKGATVLESVLSTENFEVMPDGAFKLYDYVDEVRKVSTALTENGLIIEHLSQSGDSLESYFAKLVGGERDA